jgi:phytoene synthase
MRFEIDRARRLYTSADAGIALLPPWSARAIAAARTLYAAILDEIEAADYDVFSQRARVSTARKLLVTASSRRRGALGREGAHSVV